MKSLLNTSVVLILILSACNLSKEKEFFNNLKDLPKPVGNTENKLFNTKAVGDLQTNTGFYYPVGIPQSMSIYLDFLQRNSKYSNKRHLGNDYSVEEGTSVIAISDSEVVFSDMNVSNYGGDTPARSGGALITKNKKADGSTFYTLYGHVKNILFNVGDKVVGGQKIAEVGPYYSKGIYLPHLHFGININEISTRGYEDDNGYTYNFVDPEAYMKNNEPEKYEFQGSGSLISNGRDCYGCNKDTAPIYANGKKGVVTFQWKYDPSRCDHIDISSDSGKNYSTGIIAGSWDKRSNDKYYAAKLPVSIGHPREIYNLVAITLPTNIDKNDYINVKCSNNNPIGSKTEIPRKIKGIQLTSGSTWNGQGSIISANTVDERNYGSLYDISLMKTSDDSNFGTTTFQWQPSSRCQKILLRDSNNSSQFANVSIRAWNDANNVTVLSNIQLPYVISKNTKSDLELNNYYVITVRSNTFGSGKVFAECTN